MLEDYIGAKTTAHTFQCISRFQMIKTLYYIDNGVIYFTNVQITHVLETNTIFGQLNGFPNKIYFSTKCNSRQWFHIKI